MGTARVTYLIGETGKIDHVIEKVEVSNHSEQILKLWS
jgi:peroxiredoxin